MVDESFTPYLYGRIAVPTYLNRRDEKIPHSPLYKEGPGGIPSLPKGGWRDSHPRRKRSGVRDRDARRSDRMRKVLVAGSTGHLGRYVSKEFKRRGYWVRALVRDPDRLEDLKDLVDDVFVGDVTKPDTLRGVCDDIEIVFSSVGLSVDPRRQKDRCSYRDVDYQGNKNLLEVARKAPVKKFIYVSVFGAHLFEHLEYVKAHEDFVTELRSSGLEYAVIRPTAFCAAFANSLNMARSGRAFIVGR